MASAAVAPSASAATHPIRETFSLALQGLQEYRLAVRRPEEPAVLCVACAECFDTADVAERKAPTKRNESGAAAGQRAQDLRAVGVAGDRRLGANVGDRRNDLRELLSAQPADLVEFMYAHVDEDAATVGAKRGCRRFAIPLVAGHEIQCTQIARDDALPQALQ